MQGPFFQHVALVAGQSGRRFEMRRTSKILENPTARDQKI